MPFDSILRVFSAEFSEFGEYLPTLIAIVVSLMATWYFAFNSLTRSTVRNRFRDLIRGERSESESMNNPSDGAQESQGNQDESPPGDGQDTGTSPADFRAAGDGWEGDEDIDYVLDEDILNQGIGNSLLIHPNMVAEDVWLSLVAWINSPRSCAK